MISYRVEAPHFVARFDVTDYRVTFTAPILSYLRGWSEGEALTYCREHGWTVIRL